MIALLMGGLLAWRKKFLVSEFWFRQKFVQLAPTTKLCGTEQPTDYILNRILSIQKNALEIVRYQKDAARSEPSWQFRKVRSSSLLKTQVLESSIRQQIFDNRKIDSLSLRAGFLNHIN